MTTKGKSALSSYMAKMGAKGGAKARGAAKRQTPETYARAVAARLGKRAPAKARPPRVRQLPIPCAEIFDECTVGTMLEAAPAGELRMSFTITPEAMRRVMLAATGDWLGAYGATLKDDKFILERPSGDGNFREPIYWRYLERSGRSNPVVTAWSIARTIQFLFESSNETEQELAANFLSLIMVDESPVTHPEKLCSSILQVAVFGHVCFVD